MTVQWTVRAVPDCPQAGESIPVHHFAGMAELADAYGSGPYGGNSMEVQVLLPAPNKTGTIRCLFCLV